MLEVGRVYRHPKHGVILIIDGFYLDPVYGRLSNFWEWRKVNGDGTLGKRYSGYGDSWPEVVEAEVQQKVILRKDV